MEVGDGFRDPTDGYPDYDPGEARPEPPRCAVCGAVAMPRNDRQRNLRMLACTGDTCGVWTAVIKGQLRRMIWISLDVGHVPDMRPSGVVKHPDCA